MQRVVWSLLLLLVLVGCGQGRFQLSKQEYQAKVQVLGVLPLLIDRTSPLDYPQREGLYDLLARASAGKHGQLVALLKKKKGYFDVRSLPGNADLLAMSVLAGLPTLDPQGRPEGLVFNPAAIAKIAEQNVVDALLVVVFSGAQVEETRRSRHLIESLRTRYSDLLATAAVVSRDGQVLWQLAGADSYQALQLQYADFDEAYYNHTDQVQVKNIRLAGIEPLLVAAPDKNGQPQLSKIYQELFARISSGISPGLLDSLR